MKTKQITETGVRTELSEADSRNFRTLRKRLLPFGTKELRFKRRSTPLGTEPNSIDCHYGHSLHMHVNSLSELQPVPFLFTSLTSATLQTGSYIYHTEPDFSCTKLQNPPRNSSKNKKLRGYHIYRRCVHRPDD